MMNTLSTNLKENARFPFCKGCSHTTVLRKLDEALVSLQLDPQNVALVTDIGCIGLADSLFPKLHTVHTTHGRSTAFAAGIELADSYLAEGRLKTVVLIGDGGATIGLQHLVHAALLNVDITVLICNNFVYGMTGGQSSCYTPERFVTATTPGGNILPPLDLCGILEKSRAPFVARASATDRELSTLIKDAIAFPGFAAVEILELCTEFGVPKNELDGKKLLAVAEENGWSLGILRKDESRIPFAEQYRQRIPTNGEERSTKKTKERRSARLRKPLSIVLAGSAGERVQSSAMFLCQTAAEHGLFVTQKNDNPVTQGTGFSLSDLQLSPDEILFTGVEHPDIIIATSLDGYNELSAQGVLQRRGKRTRLILDDTIAADNPESIALPLRSTFGPKLAAMGALMFIAFQLKLFEEDFLVELIRGRLGAEAELFLERLARLRTQKAVSFR